MFQRILIPTDFGAAGAAAIRLARSHFPHAERTLFHALDPKALAASLTGSVSADADREERERAALTALEAQARPGESCGIAIGAAADAIVQRAKALNVDLIVMGTHARTGIAHFLHGSVAEAVIRHGRVPVLIVHEGDG